MTTEQSIKLNSDFEKGYEEKPKQLTKNMITPPDTITISMEEYQELIDRDFMLTCLENAGVDNWDGVEYAHSEYYAFKNEQGDEEI